MHRLYRYKLKHVKSKLRIAFFKRSTIIYSICIILLLLAIRNAYSFNMSDRSLKGDIQTSLDYFEQIELKNEMTKLNDSSLNTNIDELKPIATISIERIRLNASVLPDWSDELLDISVSKFNGPDPNEPGNFIVIGHGYDSDTHFGRLHLLEVGDLIHLTDLLGRTVPYEVYEVMIIKPSDIEKLKTDEKLTLTLVTCDKDNAYRLVIKSKAIGSTRVKAN